MQSNHKHIRSVLSLMMAIIFMMPLLVKMEHHHDPFVCHADSEKHLHEHHDDCAICHFEFSLFNRPDDTILPAKAIRLCSQVAEAYQSFVPSGTAHTFFLRGPPAIVAAS